jgi:hypothetical protein
MPGDRRTPVREARDPATRRAAVELGDEIGDKLAAARYGVAEGTISVWRSRLRESEPAAPGASRDTDGGSDPDASADDLEREADEARTAERRALERAEQAAERDDARAAREYVATAREHGTRRGTLQAEARAAREHGLRVRESQSKLGADGAQAYLRIVRLYIESLGFGWSRAHADLADALLHAFTHGSRRDGGNWHVQIPEHELTAARAAIERQLARAEADPAPNATGASEVNVAEIEAQVEAENAADADGPSAEIVKGAPEDFRASRKRSTARFAISTWGADAYG